jgi:excisionase family DNA binding protein
MQKAAIELETLMLPAEVSEKLRLGESTVYHLAHKGILPGMKIGGTLRFSPSTVAKYLKDLETQRLGKVA